jgi:hypothetical protein
MHELYVILGLDIAGWAATSTTCGLATTAAIPTTTSTSSPAVIVRVAVLRVLALPVTLSLLRQTSLLRLLRLLKLLLLWLLLTLSSRELTPLEVRNGSRNRLGVFVDIETLVDAGGDGVNLGAKISFDVVKVEAVVPVDQVNSQTKVAITTRSTNTVKVGLGVLGEVKVDDNIDSLDIDTTGEEIGTDQVSADAVAEVVENTVSCVLLHLCVTVKARVSELGDFLGKKFDSVGGIAEDDRLVDLELGEEGVQAVDLLLLFDKGVVLGNTPQSELIHQVNLIGTGHVLIRKVLDRQRECGGEKHNLPVLGVELQKLFDNRSELDGEKLIGFVHDEHRAFAKVGNILASEIENSTWGTNHNMDGILQTNNIISKTGTTGRDHDVDTEMLAKSLAYLRGLHSKLTCGDKNKTLDLGDLGVDAFQSRDDKGSCLASAVLCSCKNISTG